MGPWWMNHLVWPLLAASASAVLLVVVFVPLEKLFPARKQAIFRPAWTTDLAFFLGQYLVFTSAVFGILSWVRGHLDLTLLKPLQTLFAEQPPVLQVVETLILSDVCVYFGHRLQHRVDFLWRFHAVHHSSEHLDWLAAHREHPLDTVYTVGLINLPAMLLNVPMRWMAGVIAFRGMWAIFIHANVRMNLGPLRYILGSPETHHWHHERDRDTGNYGNLCPWLDVLFGTYFRPDSEPEALGLATSFPKSYWKQLLSPLVPKRWISNVVNTAHSTLNASTSNTLMQERRA